MDGEVEIVVGSGKKENVISKYGKNQLIGELSLLTDAMTTATVRAATPVTALRIEKEVFLQLMESDGLRCITGCQLGEQQAGPFNEIAQ